MKKYLTITVREQMQGMTVEKVLYDYLELTKKQVSRAKFRPDGICKNKVQCRVTEKVSMGDEIIYAWKQMKYSLHSWFCKDSGRETAYFV